LTVRLYMCGVSVCQYELLFCVDDNSDAAIMVVNSLIQKYPQVNARLFAGGLFPFHRHAVSLLSVTCLPLMISYLRPCSR